MKDESEVVRESISLLSHKWHPQIIYALLEKKSASFTGIKDSIEGISGKVLSESLKDLKEQGIVQEKPGTGKKYVLTEKGKGLEKVFDSVYEWRKQFSRESQHHILVVEDNEDQAELYKRWLESKYMVSTANTKVEAYEEFDDSIDAIVLDRSLEGSTARDILEGSEKFASKPVVILTGIEPKKEILDLDISDYLIKPVSKENLEDALASAVKISQEDDKTSQLMSLLSKKKAIDRRKSINESNKYRELLDEIDRLSSDIDKDPEDLNI